jgi:hypothetical protein
MKKLALGLLMGLELLLANPSYSRGLGGFKKTNNSNSSINSATRASEFSFSAIAREKTTLTSTPAPLLPPALFLPHYPNFDEPFMKCFNEACKIEYAKDSPFLDSWQTPNITRNRKKGDCEDISFYLYDLLKKANIKSRVVIGYMNGNYQNGHTWVEL